MIRSREGQHNHRLEIGLLICILGTQFSRILIEWFKIQFELTNPLYILGILLLIDFTILSRWEIVISSSMRWILLFQGIVAFEAILYGKTADNNFIFTLFVMAMIFGLSTQIEPHIDEDFFIKSGWMLTGVGSVLLAVVIFQNSNGSFLDTRFMRLPMGGDRLTLSAIASANMVFLLLYKAKTPLMRVIKILFALAAIYDILACNRRGLMVSYLVILAVYLVKENGAGITKKKILAAFAVVGGLAVIIMWIMRSDSDLALVLRRYIDSLGSALRSYMGVNGVNDSGASRNNVLQTVPKEYLDSSMRVILFGNGPFYRQIDVPYLQAFTDLGAFMGVFYLGIQLILPLKLILKRTENRVLMFAQLFEIQAIALNIYSGTCYGHYKFAPLILLVFIDYIVGKGIDTGE